MFYRISELDVEETGVRNGMAQAELEKKRFSDKKNYDYYMRYFLSYTEESQVNHTQFPEADFNLEHLTVKPNVLVTDFLFFGPALYHRFLINVKVQDILARYRVAPYRLYRAGVYGKNAPIDDYAFLYVPSLPYEYIDFSRSVFSKGNKFNKEMVAIRSLNEFLEYPSALNRERIVLSKAVDNYDYFNLLILPDPIISERLFQEFKKQEITGLQFTAMPEEALQLL